MAFQLWPNVQPKYGYIRIFQSNFENEIDPELGITHPTQNIKFLEYSLCGTNGTYYNYSDMVVQELFDVSSYFCIKDKTAISFAGTYLSSLWRLITIDIMPCINSTDSDVICATPTEQQAFFESSYLEVLTINHYFDP